MSRMQARYQEGLQQLKEKVQELSPELSSSVLEDDTMLEPENLQALYMLLLGQQREMLQQKGDLLDEQIVKAEREVQQLQKSFGVVLGSALQPETTCLPACVALCLCACVPVCVGDVCVHARAPTCLLQAACLCVPTGLPVCRPCAWLCASPCSPACTCLPACPYAVCVPGRAPPRLACALPVRVPCLCRSHPSNAYRAPSCCRIYPPPTASLSMGLPVCPSVCLSMFTHACPPAACGVCHALSHTRMRHNHRHSTKVEAPLFRLWVAHTHRQAHRWTQGQAQRQPHNPAAAHGVYFALWG